MVNVALVKTDDLFSGMYEADIKGGRPSIAPEKLRRAVRFTASAISANSWNKPNTTSCFAGSPAWPWMMRCG